MYVFSKTVSKYRTSMFSEMYVVGKILCPSIELCQSVVSNVGVSYGGYFHSPWLELKKAGWISMLL